MKSVLKIFLFALPMFASAQNESNYLDSMLVAFKNASQDTTRLEISRNLGFYYQDSEPGVALPYHESQLKLAQKLNFKLWEADAYEQVAFCYLNLNNLPLAYENYMHGLRVAEDSTGTVNGWGYSNFSFSRSPSDARKAIVGMLHFELSSFYNRARYFEQTRYHLFKALRIGEMLNNQKILSLCNRDIGYFIYFLKNKPDSAFIYFKRALNHYKISPYQRNRSVNDEYIGYYFANRNEFDSAKFYFNAAINESKDNYAFASSAQHARVIRALGQLYEAIGELDSALVITLRGMKISESINDYFGQVDGCTKLASIYQSKNQYDLAYDYSVRAKNLSDSLNEAYITKLMQFQNLSFDQRIRLSELEKKSQEEKNKIKMYGLTSGLFTFSLVTLLLYRNNRHKQRANKVLEGTLSNLKAAQNQLIQSEKMASLGELTAGIAHEIQNPLNFVNNFSDVNKELLAELNDEIEKGNFDEVKSIAKDVIDNEEKINHHGKRADAIVKGMLQHSRSSSGTKELTDINTLCDEYLRLSYHGLRAKDKSFNAKFETDFDPSLPKINVVPQDIGRVVLNLITNAFYVVNEKSKQNISRYEPTVTVSTKNENEKVIISVKDNGNGIPDNIKEKIFQPFFTTKPTGQGTGLGLSLSYDIVKVHGGEIKVDTETDKGTSFKIILPDSR